MSAQLAVQRQGHGLTVIDGGLSKPKRGKPSAEDNARLELAVMRREVRRAGAEAAPLLRQLLLKAQREGTQEYRTTAALAYVIDRLVRQWSDEPQSAA